MCAWKKRNRFVSRSRAIRGNDRRCAKWLKTRQWHYRRYDYGWQYSILIYNLNKIPSYDCFSFWCREYTAFLCCCWCVYITRTLAYLLACLYVYVWRIGCDLLYRNFIRNSIMSTYSTTHIHIHSHVYRQNVYRCTVQLEQASQKKITNRRGAFFSFSQLNSNWKKSNNKMQR